MVRADEAAEDHWKKAERERGRDGEEQESKKTEQMDGMRTSHGREERSCRYYSSVAAGRVRFAVRFREGMRKTDSKRGWFACVSAHEASASDAALSDDAIGQQ